MSAELTTIDDCIRVATLAHKLLTQNITDEELDELTGAAVAEPIADPRAA